MLENSTFTSVSRQTRNDAERFAAEPSVFQAVGNVQGPVRTSQSRVSHTTAGLLILLLAGLCLRLFSIDRVPMWVDEAESAINPLTILQHAVPTGSYLGLPVYENTLLAPWPESKEYRYKDISYSRNGLALYHGWFPLYAIAGAL